MALLEIIDLGLTSARYFESGTDIVLVVDGNEIPVHRQILAHRSEYFQIMFYGKFSESKKDRIEIKDIKWSPFKKLIDYIYTGKLIAQVEELLELCSVAHTLRLSDATEKISIFMVNKVTRNNFIDYLNCACEFDLPDLKQKCINLWGAKWKLDNDRMCCLSEDAILVLLRVKINGAPIDAYEKRKFILALSWLQANDKSKTQVLMSVINLKIFKHEDIRHTVWPSGYFTAEQLLDAVLPTE